MGAIIAFPIRENEQVQDYIKTLNVNNRNKGDFMALLDAVEYLESMLMQSDKNMDEMIKQLSELKEIHKHPIKTELRNISNAIQENTGAAKSWLIDLKEKIVNFCKKTLENFKDAGVSALDKTASFLKLKDGLEAIGNHAAKNNELCGKAINKIETFSSEYHKAGNALKNMGRIISGKEPTAAVKEKGNLSKVLIAPYGAEKSLWAKIERKAYVTAKDLSDFHTKAQIKRLDKQDAKEADKAQKTDIFKAVDKHKECVEAGKKDTKDKSHETKKSKHER